MKNTWDGFTGEPLHTCPQTDPLNVGRNKRFHGQELVGSEDARVHVAGPKEHELSLWDIYFK